MTTRLGYGLPVSLKSSDDDGNFAPYTSCYDCGRQYGNEYGFCDLIVPNEIWLQISPTGNEGGLLCPSCIVRRCTQLDIECKAKFTSGPFSENTVSHGEMSL